MKSNRLLKALLIAGIAIVILATAILPNFSSSRSFGRAIESEAAKGEGATIRIRDLTSFRWERLYVFGPYTPVAEIDKALGFHWARAKDTGIEMSDTFSLVVFVSNQKVEAYFKLPRNKADFSEESLSRGFTPEDGIFITIRHTDGRQILTPIHTLNNPAEIAR